MNHQVDCKKIYIFGFKRSLYYLVHYEQLVMSHDSEHTEFSVFTLRMLLVTQLHCGSRWFSLYCWKCNPPVHTSLLFITKIGLIKYSK